MICCLVKGQGLFVCCLEGARFAWPRRQKQLSGVPVVFVFLEGASLSWCSVGNEGMNLGIEGKDLPRLPLLGGGEPSANGFLDAWLFP